MTPDWRGMNAPGAGDRSAIGGKPTYADAFGKGGLAPRAEAPEKFIGR